MAYFTEQQMKQARKANLYEYLLEAHPDDFLIEGDSIRPKNNHSISIKRGYSGYKDFATEEKGNSVDFLCRHMHYPLISAVFALCGDNVETVTEEPRIQPDTEALRKWIEHAEPAFPEPTSGPYRQLYAYLMSRGISKETIDTLIEYELIYQDAHNNIVFMNEDKDWGERRGTNTYADARCIYRRDCESFNEDEHQWCTHMEVCEKYKKDAFRGMIANSRRDGFWSLQVCAAAPEKVYVCEAAIDAISLYELHRLDGVQEKALYVSIGGTAKQPAIERLKQEYACVILAVDNDGAGEACRNRNPDLKYIIPKGKDWNDDLLGRKK